MNRIAINKSIHKAEHTDIDKIRLVYLQKSSASNIGLVLKNRTCADTDNKE